MWNRIVVTDQNRGVYGALVHDHLRKRRLLFHEKLGWDIPRSAHIEQDQYDRAETVYILVERGGLVEGYARLLPTLARVSYGSVEFSYMMRDATLGLLPGIPPSILGARPAPQAEGVWEISRVEAAGRGGFAGAVFDHCRVYGAGGGCGTSGVYPQKLWRDCAEHRF